MTELENKSQGGNSAVRRFVFVFLGFISGAGAVFLFSHLDMSKGGAILGEAWKRALGNKIVADEIPFSVEPASSFVLPEPSEPPPTQVFQTSSKKVAVLSKPKAAVKAKPATLPKKSDAKPVAPSVLGDVVQSYTPPECDFGARTAPDHRILISEVAWMGTKKDSGAEWIELRNNSGRDIDLAGWKLVSSDEAIEIDFKKGELVKAGNYFMLEKDEKALKTKADRLYDGTLSNQGMWLKLFDSVCNVSDEINAEGGWMAGDSTSKRTLERNSYDLSWGTSVLAGGTPREKNNPEVALLQISGVPVSSAGEADAGGGSGGEGESGSVRINEVMAGSSANASYEFIELYNPGAGAVTLTGWSLRKRSSSGSESTLVSASYLEGRTLGGGEYMILANQGGYAGASDVSWPASYTLAYANNGVVLYNAAGVKADEALWADLPKDRSLRRGSDGTFGLGDPTPGSP